MSPDDITTGEKVTVHIDRNPDGWRSKKPASPAAACRRHGNNMLGEVEAHDHGVTI
jgi:hypothetical protein